MNPSAKGWLNKLLTTVDKDFSDEDVLETIYPNVGAAVRDLACPVASHRASAGC